MSWRLDVLSLRDATPRTSCPVEEVEPPVEDVQEAVLQYVEPYPDAEPTIASMARIRRKSWREIDRCYWCNVQLTTPVGAGKLAKDARTKEHIMPSSFGGTDNEENLTAACYACNSGRGRDLTWVPYATHKGDPNKVSPSQRHVFKHLGHFKRMKAVAA